MGTRPSAIHRGQVRIWSRLGRDVTSSYPELAAITAAGRQTLLLDGVICAAQCLIDVGPFVLLQSESCGRQLAGGRPSLFRS